MQSLCDRKIEVLLSVKSQEIGDNREKSVQIGVMQNIAWVTKEHADGSKSFAYTDAGKAKLDPVVKRKIDFVTEYNSSAPKGMDKAFRDDSFIFANPYGYVQKKAGYKNAGINNQVDRSVDVINQKSDYSPEADRMQKIEENYAYDKSMLARSESRELLSGTSGDFKASPGQGNVIKKTLDEIVDNIKSELKDK